VWVALHAGETKRERAELRFLALDESGLAPHRERIPADQVRGVVRAAPAADVEVGERELLGTLDGVRRGHRVEPVEIVRVTAGGFARRHLARGMRGWRTRRDEPGLARVGIKARLKERLARERLVGYRREDPLHPSARRSAADPREEAERAVRAPGLGERRENEDDPLRPAPVVHERGRTKLSA